MEEKILERVEGFRKHWAEISAGLPEAGGIAFMTVYINGQPVNVTARAGNPYDALAGLQAAVILAKDGLGISTEKPSLPTAQPPRPDAAAIIASEAGNAELAEKFQQQVDAPPPPSRKGADVPYKIFDASIVEVLPQPDDKTTLCFYGDGDKYPRIKVSKWRVEAANGLMKYVTAESMAVAKKYALPCRVYYTDGQPYTTTDGKTGKYKDVEHVRPLRPEPKQAVEPPPLDEMPF